MINIDIGFMRELDALPRKEKVLKAALHYASMGQRVLPQIGKAPQVKEEDASSDPMTIRRWFGPGGAFEGQNVGLVLTDCRVLDLDRHDGKDGIAFIRTPIDQIAAPREATPNNGYHLLISNTDLRGVPSQGVDIKHRITTWPSMADGKEYRWETGGEPGKLDGPLIMRLGGRQMTSGPDNSFSSKFTPLAPSTYINHYLEYLDPDMEYDEWVKVGMAIHSNDIGPDSLEIWEEWSKGGSKFTPGLCAKKWETFSAEREKSVKLRWLITLAKKNGAPAHEHDGIYYRSSSVILQELNDNYGIFDAGGRICIAGTVDGRANFYSQHDLELLYANKPVMMGDKPVNPVKLWILSDDRRTIKKIGMWMPEAEPKDSLNTWTGLAVPAVKCKKSDIAEFIEFCVEDICRGNRKYAEYLWDLMALKVQRPLMLPGIALVISGGEGTGKGMLTGILSQIIGPNHSKSVSQRSSWVGDYSGDLISNVVYLEAHEAAWSGHHSEASRLKALMTEKSMDWNAKYKSQWTSPNNMFITITTNDDWAVPAGHDSRRYFVLKASDKRKMDAKYWSHLASLIGRDRETGETNNPKYIGMIRYWLENRKIENEMGRAMETEWLIQQRRETAVDSREDLFVSWVKATFCYENAFGFNRPGGLAIPKVQVTENGETLPGQWVRTNNLSIDYREFAKKHSRSRVYDDKALYEKMATLGLTLRKFRKHRVIEQGRPLSDTPSDSKVSILFVPESDVIERNITINHPLFGDDNDDSDTDT